MYESSRNGEGTTRRFGFDTTDGTRRLMALRVIVTGLRRGPGQPMEGKTIPHSTRNCRMADSMQSILDVIQDRDPDKPKLRQAAEEIVNSLAPVLQTDDSGVAARALHAIFEPERQIAFRVAWEDDNGVIRYNRGFRVQQSSLLGPYKGGLRFAEGVNFDALRFLALEQTFKNALTGLGLGSGKGGADIDYRSLSRSEKRRFTVAFVRALSREIGAQTDVPAGDIGVGSREVGWMFGELKAMTRTWDGTLTGKPLHSGGVLLRTEATGYGLVYFLHALLAHDERDLKLERVLVSGSGNVALHAARKVAEMGGTVVTLSSRRGTAICTQGFTLKQIDAFKGARADGASLAEWCGETGVSFEEGIKPWSAGLDAAIALPCAVENELDAPDVEKLVDNGLRYVAEGANMPSTNAAIAAYNEAGVTYGPGKAANAGGVAVSGLEMRQNASRTPLSREAVDQELQTIMSSIHKDLRSTQSRYDGIRLSDAANIVAFERLKSAALEQGIV